MLLRRWSKARPPLIDDCSFTGILRGAQNPGFFFSMRTGKVSGESWDLWYQWTLVLFFFYLLCFPFLLSPLREWLNLGPEICYYKARTGHDCIFCGTTTAVYAFLKHGVLPPLHIVVAMVCLVIEWVRKLVILVFLFRRGSLALRARLIDVGITLLLLAISLIGFLVPRA